jgi:hypothetical protein
MSGNPATQKFASRFGDTVDSLPVTDSECDDLGAYGFLRGTTDRSEMLELRKKTGNIRAIQYGWISKIDFDPSAGITLYAGDETIRITGRNLNRIRGDQTTLLGGIFRHRVPWVRESDQSSALQADKETVVVEKIEW